MKKVCIFANDNQKSLETKGWLKEKLEIAGFTVLKEYTKEVELVVSIGGDGVFLNTLHRLDFPDVPFLGINTGNLGFFQELYPDEVDGFLELLKSNKHCVQIMHPVTADIETETETFQITGLNEVVIRATKPQAIHVNIFIGGKLIEKFTGDGLLICTPAGSTAYNYSLGGSIIDPRISMLQITPIAPMNTTAHRSFTSSIILPVDLLLSIKPSDRNPEDISIVSDGILRKCSNIKEMKLSYSDINVNLLRSENYDFWAKVKSKFL